MERLVTLNVRNIPLTLRQQFKAICAFKGQSVQDEIQRFMREEIELAKKDPNQKVLF